MSFKILKMFQLKTYRKLKAMIGILFCTMNLCWHNSFRFLIRMQKYW